MKMGEMSGGALLDSIGPLYRPQSALASGWRGN